MTKLYHTQMSGVGGSCQLQLLMLCIQRDAHPDMLLAEQLLQHGCYKLLMQQCYALSASVVVMVSGQAAG